MRPIDGVKAVEDAALVLLGDADARIGHGEDGRCAAGEADGEASSLLIVADPVGDEVVEDLDQPLAAGKDFDSLLRVQREGDVLLPQGWLEIDGELADDLGEVYLVVRQVVRIDGGKIDDGADEVREAVALADDGIGDALQFFGRDGARADQFGKAADAGERGVHLVRDVGNKVVFGARGGHDVRHVGNEQHVGRFPEGKAEAVIPPADPAGESRGLAGGEHCGDFGVLRKAGDGLVLFIPEQIARRPVDERDLLRAAEDDDAVFHAVEDELFDAAVLPHARELGADLGVHIVHHFGEGLQLGVGSAYLFACGGRSLLRQLFHRAEDKGGGEPGDEQTDEDIDGEQEQDGGQRVDKDGKSGIRLRGEADEVGLPLPLERAAIIDAVIAEGSAVAHGKPFAVLQGLGDLFPPGMILHGGGIRLRIAEDSAVRREKCDAHAAKLGSKSLRALLSERLALPLGGIDIHINLQLPVDRLDRLPVKHVRKEDGEQYDAEDGDEQRDEQYSLAQGKTSKFFIDLRSA